MKRMINGSRIAAHLRPHGFALAVDIGDSLITYSRPAETPELWEQIRVTVGGKRGEAVGASVGANVRYGGRGGYGLLEAREVPEAGSAHRPPPAQPCLTILRDREHALTWERLVADICPNRSRTFAREVGPGLLARTADARAAVNRYLELFGTSNWRELRAKLEPRATPPELREAERIATTPPMIEIYNGREFYKTIILGIMLNSDRVEGRQIVERGAPVWPEFDRWSKERPDWSKWALIWRIDILADRMLARYPEQMPTKLPDA